MKKFIFTVFYTACVYSQLFAAASREGYRAIPDQSQTEQLAIKLDRAYRIYSAAGSIPNDLTKEQEELVKLWHKNPLNLLNLAAQARTEKASQEKTALYERLWEFHQEREEAAESCCLQ